MALPFFVGSEKRSRTKRADHPSGYLAIDYRPPPFVNSLSGTFCRKIDSTAIASAFPVVHDALPAELKRLSLVSSTMAPQRRLNRVDATSQHRLISPQSRTLHKQSPR